MSFWRYALMLFLALAMVRAICGQTPLGSQSGVLVLRNGHVLLGDVTRAGDYYIVSPSQGSELRLKNDEVELFCGSMDEAYEFKARHLSGLSAKPHLELAKWCLRQGLYDKCSDQIAAARRAEPDNQDAKDLETRLKLIVEAPPEPTPAKAAPTVAAEELERALRDLPRGSVEKFGTNVQPILLNRCGLNKCHGPNTDSQFRLLRPPQGQTVSRRYTQRNLYASLRYLDALNPEASPLVALPQQRHGNSLSAVFDKHSAGQLAELVAWAKMTVSPSATMASSHPATIAPTETTLSQPAAASGAAPTSPGPDSTVRVMRPPHEQASAAPEAATKPALPRDRFDPEIFNRRYHGK
ncbi:MAG: hypothetical protein JF612_01830 [Planctomycetia bacterium]|nr:hypothetical protein [Planctomycetia bacterium]